MGCKGCKYEKKNDFSYCSGCDRAYAGADNSMEIMIDCDKEIARLTKEKEELIDKFVRRYESINAQIKYLKSLKENRVV